MINLYEFERIRETRVYYLVLRWRDGDEPPARTVCTDGRGTRAEFDSEEAAKAWIDENVPSGRNVCVARCAETVLR